jgi:sugar lactone lactonase YvrE
MSDQVSRRGGRLVALVAVLTAASLCAGLVGSAGAERPHRRAGHGTFTYRLAGERVFPEGIAFDRRSGSFFVSSTGSGAIYRGKLWQRKARVYLPGGADGRAPATGPTPNVAGVEVDGHGRLYVAGGGSGYVWVYDIRSRRLIRRFTTPGAGGFLNDLVVTHGGDVWVTDSYRPVLFRIRAAAIHRGRDMELPELRFEGGPQYRLGAINLNGIVAGPRGRYLLVVDYDNGELWRADPPSGRETQVQLSQVDLDGGPVVHGDGLVQRGSILYVVRSENAVDKLRLSDDGRRARRLSTTTDPTFDFTTTAALAGGRLLVVNSQFDAAFAGQPGVTPFTVSSIRRP